MNSLIVGACRPQRPQGLHRPSSGSTNCAANAIPSGMPAGFRASSHSSTPTSTTSTAMFSLTSASSSVSTFMPSSASIGLSPVTMSQSELASARDSASSLYSSARSSLFCSSMSSSMATPPTSMPACASMACVSESPMSMSVSTLSTTSKAPSTFLMATTPLSQNGMPTTEFTSTPERDSLPCNDDGCITPRKRIFPVIGLKCMPQVPDHMLPAVGMEFADLESAMNFYKDYAHEAGFSVRIGQHTSVEGDVTLKRFYCSREGFRREGEEKTEETAPNLVIKKKKRKYVQKFTRCGCEALLVIKRTLENRYKVEKFQPVHTHILVSPRSRHLLRSNRQVSEKVKTTLFDCHKASIGTSLAYRYLRVNEGGFRNVGCTKRDLQNYHGSLRALIKSSDAQMFVDNLAKKNSINPGFYFDYVVDDKGKLVNVFWADTTCKKNYAHFGEMLSFDSTRNTNEYDMVFTPFTGVNHHGACVLFGAALISNERIDSYEWLFNTFLKAMGGVAPRLIITDEDASMKAAIANVFPSTKHRLCMWHIMMKLPEKVGFPVREDEEFYKRVNHCVYSSETSEEFESLWVKIIEDFKLENNDWLANRYHIRKSWIPVYFTDIFLSGILRTTSRSESANSFFKCFIGYKHSLVEFWVRFDTAVEEQREKELMEDNASLHTEPILKTGWPIEKHGSQVFTYEIFLEFQKEVLAARDRCIVDSMKREGNFKLCSIIDDSSRIREVSLDTSNMVGKCSCMLFQTHGIPCRHIIYVLRGAKQNELPSHYVLKRWTKNCKREVVYDADGNLLEEKERTSMDTEVKKLASDMRKEIEDIFQQAGSSIHTMQVVRSKFQNFADEVRQELPTNQRSRVEELENFTGCTIPSQVHILPPSEHRSKGSIKRLRAHFDKGGSDRKKEEAKKKKNERIPRLCGSCKQLVLHDKRNCPKKDTTK